MQAVKVREKPGSVICAMMWHMMKRTNFYFPVAMLDQLRQLSTRTGLPVSELIRRAIEDYLKWKL
jgi:predicted DNA-binding protein